VVHATLPVVSLYVPATHAVHVPPFGPEKPALQVQAASAEPEIGELELVGHPRHVVATVAPTVAENVPAAQSVHAAVPVAILYLPATQAVHSFVQFMLVRSSPFSMVLKIAVIDVSCRNSSTAKTPAMSAFK
jgi:hypothetical protein